MKMSLNSEMVQNKKYNPANLAALLRMGQILSLQKTLSLFIPENKISFSTTSVVA